MDGQFLPAAEAHTRLKKKLVADLFCGAGGSSTGAQRALRALGQEMVLTCLNHWPTAIETHQRNHPEARHYVQDIASVRPSAVVPEGYLDLLMASPTCTHHSRARGGKPTSDQQRSDPWHVITWLTELRVRRLLIENVPEFQDWGPVDLRTGKPVPSRKGEYFRRWIQTIKGLGYKVDYRVLNAADYGDATTRQRFFLMARSDGKPIVWPEPTHSRDGGADLLGTRRRWRAARDIINWSAPGKSIFDRPRPLAPKTLARIMAGAKKFGWPDPFLVVLRQHMDGRSIDGPLPSITAGGTHIGIARQIVTPLVLGQQSSAAAISLTEPVLQPAGKPFVCANRTNNVPQDINGPIPTNTTTTGGGLFLTEPVLLSVTGGDKPKAPKSADDPLGTITTHNGVGVAEGFVFPVNQGSDRLRGHRSVDNPLPTILTRDSLGVVEPVLVHMKGRSDALNVDQPAPTVTTKSQLAVAEPLISPYYGSGSGETCKSVEQPLDTVTAKARFGIVEPCLITVAHGEWADAGAAGRRAHSIDNPIPGITASSVGVGVVEAVADPFVISPRHGMAGAGPSPRDTNQPLPTITAGGSQIGVVEPVLSDIHSDDTLRKAIEQGRQVMIDGRPHLLDIRFRMLEPYELARAMGFSDDEVEYEFAGTKTEITRQIGNAVPVNTACALVSALMRE